MCDFTAPGHSLRHPENRHALEISGSLAHEAAQIPPTPWVTKAEYWACTIMSECACEHTAIPHMRLSRPCEMTTPALRTRSRESWNRLV